MKTRRFSRLEGVLLLSLVIAICCCLFPYINDIMGTDSDGFMARKERKEGYRKRNAARNDSAPYYTTETLAPETFDFDPNTADSTQLLRLGLAPWQVRNIYKYRAKGGRYRKPEDFAKLYGLTLEDFERLKPHIKIKKEVMAADVYSSTSDAHHDDFHHSAQTPPRNNSKAIEGIYQPKLHEGQYIDINKADTNQLKMIPGIGSYYASKIMKARQRLGGFASVSQVGQIEGVPSEALAYMRITDKSSISKLHVNTMNEQQLSKHPYLRYIQAKDIVRLRRLKGPFKTMEELQRVPTLSPDDIQKLAPYIEF